MTVSGLHCPSLPVSTSSPSSSLLSVCLLLWGKTFITNAPLRSVNGAHSNAILELIAGLSSLAPSADEFVSGGDSGRVCHHDTRAPLCACETCARSGRICKSLTGNPPWVCLRASINCLHPRYSLIIVPKQRLQYTKPRPGALPLESIQLPSTRCGHTSSRREVQTL